jgi:multidrug transporter EmrE-like cation transporter
MPEAGQPLPNMNVAALIFITLIYAAVSAYGLFLLKDAASLISGRALVGAVFYGGGFLIWIAMLRMFPLSIAFPIAAGSLIVATSVVARLFLGEMISTVHLVGIALIVAGIFFVMTRAA